MKFWAFGLWFWVFHHLVYGVLWWWEEKRHLYVIIIKYQNDLRLVSHSSPSSAPLRPHEVFYHCGGKTFTPTSWFTIRSPYSFAGWCHSHPACPIHLFIVKLRLESAGHLPWNWPLWFLHFTEWKNVNVQGCKMGVVSRLC